MMTEKNCRKTAMNLIYRVIFKNSYSNIVLNSFLNNDKFLSFKDRDFVCRLFYGVLETKLTLDHIISEYSKTKKIQSTVQTILEMAIYELLYMDISNYAVVNEYVNIAKQSKNRNAAGFVNAILRSFIRKNKHFNLPFKEENKLENLKIKYSCSPWIIKSLITDYGLEAAKVFLENQLKNSKIAIRVNTKKINSSDLISALNEENIVSREFAVKNCLTIEKGNIFKTKAFSNGLFHVQDVSSQICSLIVSYFKPNSVLDVCSAPGGKAFTIAQETNSNIVACDLYPKRVNLIKKNAKRLGILKIDCVVFNAENEYHNIFDVVLCDVPCSGLGVIKHKPEIKYKKEFDFNKLTKTQKNILQSSSKSVKLGGYLIYSTCTLRKSENENIVNNFLKNNKNFKIYPIPDFVKIYFPDVKFYLTTINGMLECDGFFVTILKRVG